MDLKELLSYKPSKRSLERRGDAPEPGVPSKAPRTKLGSEALSKSSSGSFALPNPLAAMSAGPAPLGSSSKTPLDLNGISDEEKLRLLQSMEDEEDEDKGEELDAGAVKRMLLSFEKKVLKNQEMRVKFPDMPEKFMESELELNDEIQKLHVIATVPEYYPVLVETNALQTLLGLLSHDNSDISIAVIDFLQEVTDEGAMTDYEEEVEALVDALLAEGVLALLVQNLERLDDRSREDSDGIHNMLAIVENMCEVRNAEVCAAAGEQGLLLWLLKRVRVRQYDNNKLYAAEILAILLQGNEANQKLLGEKDGIDILLQSLAYYKRRDPNSADEIEMMENLFDALCSALMYTPNREHFLLGEGLQLMILMLKEKKMSRKSALKVLDHAMINKEGKDNCVKFIEVYGLRSLFPAFMKTAKKILKAGGSEVEHEEHICSILVSLFKNLEGSHRERLVGKFVENDHEKVERLMELHFKYQRRVREGGERVRPVDLGGEEEQDEETQLYLRRLDSGLYVLQMVDYIIAELCTSPVAAISERIKTLLSQHRDSMTSVQAVLREQAENIGDERRHTLSEGENGTSAKDSTDTVASERERLLQLADKL